MELGNQGCGGSLRDASDQNSPHLAILGRIRVNIHSGQVIWGLNAGVSVNAGEVDNLLSGSWEVERRLWSWAGQREPRVR